MVLTNLGPNVSGPVATDAALLSDGDIVVAGNFGLLRYLPNGTLDTTFGAGGLAALRAPRPVRQKSFIPNGPWRVTWERARAEDG